jgi:uncharacterized protein YndB with AHSA1/START domain/DNA-binding transcriptional ArsR family regulator
VPDDDLVFKALADPTRRYLLDLLFERDGRTLAELEAGPEMTRFGVMKHLRVLEQAGLVLRRRSGRNTLHFLNAAPIRLIHDRWIDKYSAPWVASLSALKKDLEQTMQKVFEIYIKTTPERLWQAITDPEIRRKYAFGVVVRSDWKPGAVYAGITGDETISPGGKIFEGQNLEIDPPKRLVQSFRALWSDDVKAAGTSRVTWEIQQVADSCCLTVTHDELPEDANPELYGGWPMVLSGLKTVLETGERLTTPASLMYVRPEAIA